MEEEANEVYKEYLLSKPKQDIIESTAPTHRLNSALEKYKKWIDSRENDFKYKKVIQILLQNPEMMNISENNRQKGNSDQKSELYGLRNVYATMQHTAKMLKQQQALEIYLGKHIEEDSNHSKAHKKFDGVEKNTGKIIKGKLDENRLNEMAKPREAILKSTFELHAHLMEEKKRERIKNQLKIDRIPEKLEVRAQENAKVSKPKIIDEKIIERKLTRQLYNEIVMNLKKKINKKIKKLKIHQSVSKEFKDTQDSILNFFLNIVDTPTFEHEDETYRKIAYLLTNFILKAFTKVEIK